MKLTALILTSLLSNAALAHEEVTPLQVSQATLETVKSIIRKEKVTADKIQVLDVNPEYIDSSLSEEMLEIKLAFITSTGSTKNARFLCHAAEHSTFESITPHCHRME
jgi:hypothetical protein